MQAEDCLGPLAKEKTVHSRHDLLVLRITRTNPGPRICYGQRYVLRLDDQDAD